MASAHDDADEIGEINIVPLVDVMLVLLTIVLTSATFIVNGRIPVDLARASQAAPASSTPPRVITLTREQQLYIDDRLIDGGATALAAALHDWAQDQPVVVRADAALTLGPFVELVDRIKALGYQKVSLEVRRS